MQDHVVDTGFIYNDKDDNLTISKDILFDKDCSPLTFRNLTRERRDSNKHLALKELLRDRGADYMLQSKRYEDKFAKQVTKAIGRNVTQSFDF